MTTRSYLFVPADRPERFGKALHCGADAVIVDLEDAVAPMSKDTARASLAAWLSSPAASPVLLRLNAPDTPWFEDDLRVAGAPAVHGIVLPKAERADDIARLHRRKIDWLLASDIRKAKFLTPMNKERIIDALPNQLECFEQFHHAPPTFKTSPVIAPLRGSSSIAHGSGLRRLNLLEDSASPLPR
jgi:hypothetical protein